MREGVTGMIASLPEGNQIMVNDAKGTRLIRACHREPRRMP